MSLMGCDTSHWNGNLDFGKLKSAGHHFVIAKATEGTRNTDNQFARSREEVPKHGMLFGSYHFFHPSLSITEQVNHYMQVIVNVRKGELPPSLDWESTDGNGISRAIQKARALQFVQAIERICGMPPFIYGSPGFFEQFGDMSAFSKYPLWIAHYGVKHPRLPHAWTNYTIWQYTDSNGLDLDVFNGTIEQLNKFTKQT